AGAGCAHTRCTRPLPQVFDRFPAPSAEPPGLGLLARLVARLTCRSHEQIPGERHLELARRDEADDGLDVGNLVSRLVEWNETANDPDDGRRATPERWEIAQLGRLGRDDQLE